jgi:hypothetical protein
MRQFASLLGCTFFFFYLCGCASTRSISDSGYRRDRHINWGYKGELTEFDIVGAGSTNITEADIQAALRSDRSIHLRHGEPILVIQSGALTPDDEFLREMNRYFPGAPFSGQPPEEKRSYSARLRLAAAQGGYKHLLCYWGVLETSREDHATKTLSWVPIAGMLLPDESQRMRIRLKAIVVDVATGAWRMVTPLPIQEERLSAKLNRESSDQSQVSRLKERGYLVLLNSIIEACASAKNDVTLAR